MRQSFYHTRMKLRRLHEAGSKNANKKTRQPICMNCGKHKDNETIAYLPAQLCQSLRSRGRGQNSAVAKVDGLRVSHVKDPRSVTGYGYRLLPYPLVLSGKLHMPSCAHLLLANALRSIDMRMVRNEKLVGMKLPRQNLVNAHAVGLSMDIDPESDTFGQPLSTPKGTGTFARIDRMELNGELVALKVMSRRS